MLVNQLACSICSQTFRRLGQRGIGKFGIAVGRQQSGRRDGHLVFQNIGFAFAVLVLLHHAEDKVRSFFTQYPSDQITARFTRSCIVPVRPHPFTGQFGGVLQLLLKRGAIGDHHHLEAAEPWMGAQLTHQLHHGDAFTRALGVPDNAAPLVPLLAGLQPGRARRQTRHGLLHRPVLLIAWAEFDQFTFTGLEQDKMAQDVEQVGRPQHAGNEFLLTAQGGANPADLGQHLGLGTWRDILPLDIMLVIRAIGGHPRRKRTGRDH